MKTLAVALEAIVIATIGVCVTMIALTAFMYLRFDVFKSLELRQESPHAENRHLP